MRECVNKFQSELWTGQKTNNLKTHEGYKVVSNDSPDQEAVS